MCCIKPAGNFNYPVNLLSTFSCYSYFGQLETGEQVSCGAASYISLAQRQQNKKQNCSFYFQKKIKMPLPENPQSVALKTNQSKFLLSKWSQLLTSSFPIGVRVDTGRSLTKRCPKPAGCRESHCTGQELGQASSSLLPGCDSSSSSAVMIQPAGDARANSAGLSCSLTTTLAGKEKEVSSGLKKSMLAYRPTDAESVLELDGRGASWARTQVCREEREGGNRRPRAQRRVSGD